VRRVLTVVSRVSTVGLYPVGTTPENRRFGPFPAALVSKVGVGLIALSGGWGRRQRAGSAHRGPDQL